MDHILHVRQLMATHKIDDALMCRVFLISLIGSILEWFHQLKSGNIHSFFELTQTFVACYLANRLEKIRADNFYEEIFEGTTQIFCREVSRLCFTSHRWDEIVVISVFWKGLSMKDGLFEGLVKSQPQTSHEIFKKITKYLNLEKQWLKE